MSTISITERGSDWDKHGRAWEKHNTAKASGESRLPIFDKINEGKAAQWQRVNDSTDRMVVPGGWLYRTKTGVGALARSKDGRMLAPFWF